MPRPSSSPSKSSHGRNARRGGLAFGVGIALLSGATCWLLTAPRFAVREAVLKAPEFCKEALRPVLPVGRNIFLVGTGPIEVALGKDPRVERVRLTRLWPDRVEITVTERRPVGKVWFEERLVGVDVEGRNLGSAAADSPEAGIPLLYGAIYRGDGSIDPEKVRAAAGILASANGSGIPRVTKLDFLPGGRVNLVCQGVVLIKLGRPEDLKKKLSVAASAVGIYGVDRLAYVDVELSDRPAVRFRNDR